MVTNLPKEAKAQWQKVVNARSKEEKLRELEKFYSLIPKHKGTKNLLRQVRSQMAKLREEIREDRRKRTGGTMLSPWSKPKHGIARVALISTEYNFYNFLSISPFKIDNLSHEIWSFNPYYTILEGEDYQFQLVILPPIGVSENIDSRITNMIRTCDYIIVGGLSSKSLKESVFSLANLGITITKRSIRISIKKTPSGGLRVVGWEHPPPEVSRLKSILQEYGFKHAIIKITGDLSIDEVEDLILGVVKFMKGVGVVFRDKRIIELYEIDKLNMKYIGRISYNQLPNFILNSLNLIRVYPTQDLKTKGLPIVLKKGSTVKDLALAIHKRFVKNFRYALVYRNGKVTRVSKNYILEDGDIVAIRLG